MVWQTHIAFSVLLTMLVFRGERLDTLILLLLSAALGSLLPDLDASQSKAKHLRFGHSRLKPFFALSSNLHALFGHRGVMHSLLFVTLIAIGLAVLQAAAGGETQYYVAFVLGYVSHLVADGLTKSGLQFLYPVKTPVRLLPPAIAIRTGSIGDYIFAGLCVLGAVLLFST